MAGTLAGSLQGAGATAQESARNVTWGVAAGRKRMGQHFSLEGSRSWAGSLKSFSRESWHGFEENLPVISRRHALAQSC